MIRILDHLFDINLLRHIWVESDGDHYVVFVEIETGDKPQQWPFLVPTREVATHMIDKVESAIAKLYGGDDEDDVYI